MKVNSKKIETLIRQLLVEIGEDPEREGLQKTPQRVAAAYEFLTSGSRTDADQAHQRRDLHAGRPTAW